MDKEEKQYVNEPIINLLRETIVGVCMPTFCSYCGAGYLDLTVEVMRHSEETEKLDDPKLTVVEYDVDYVVSCGKCGKSFHVQPTETMGLIKEIK